jgi:hypothetical protein
VSVGRDVEAIRARFDALDPYDASVILSILNIEDVNCWEGAHREISAYVSSAKRCALFEWNCDRRISVLRVSEHGLGHLLSPIPKGLAGKWPELIWELILAEELEIPHELSQMVDNPAISRISVSTPRYFRGFLRRYALRPMLSALSPLDFC